MSGLPATEALRQSKPAEPQIFGRQVLLSLRGRPLLANDRLDKFERNRQVQDLKLLTKLALAGGTGGVESVWSPDKGKFEGLVDITAWASMPAKGRPIDADAIAPAVKAVLDGIVVAGYLEDDGPKFVEQVTYKRALRGGNWGLFVAVQEVSGE